MLPSEQHLSSTLTPVRLRVAFKALRISIVPSQPPTVSHPHLPPAPHRATSHSTIHPTASSHGRPPSRAPLPSAGMANVGSQAESTVVSNTANVSFAPAGPHDVVWADNRGLGAQVHAAGPAGRRPGRVHLDRWQERRALQNEGSSPPLRMGPSHLAPSIPNAPVRAPDGPSHSLACRFLDAAGILAWSTAGSTATKISCATTKPPATSSIFIASAAPPLTHVYDRLGTEADLRPDRLSAKPPRASTSCPNGISTAPRPAKRRATTPTSTSARWPSTRTPSVWSPTSW